MAKEMKTPGAKLGRTETVSIRLDPRLNYLCELAARSQRRTKSSFIETMLSEHIRNMEVKRWAHPAADERRVTFGELGIKLWHVRESQRLVALAFFAPDLMTFEEQSIWTLIVQNGFFWGGRWLEKRFVFNILPDNLVQERVDDHWDAILRNANGDADAPEMPVVTRENYAPESDWVTVLEGKLK